MNFNLQHRRYLDKIRASVFKKQNEHQQQQQQQQQPTSSSQIDDNDLSLIPITSPPDNPDEYPSTFFLSPVTSNESYNAYSDSSVIGQGFNHIEPQSPASSVEDIVTDREDNNVDDGYDVVMAEAEEFERQLNEEEKAHHEKFHHLSLCFLYKYTIFNRPHSFDKFLNNLISNPIIGKYVEFMDFQQFTSIGLGRTGRMNQEIQMVTYKTISKALSMTPNLLEFLASENIQDDLNVTVLDYLFNKLLKIKALDFCGASSELFAQAFDELQITRDELSITKLSFHDCSNLSNEVFNKIFPHLTNLSRLDLNHTSITSNILLKLPTNIQLTHLSLARCSKLTTKDLINFLVNHPAVNRGSLQWLNLQIDSNVVSPLSDVYLLYTMKNLNAPNLKYLNIGGMPTNYKILLTIRAKFPQLESLNISHAHVTVEELNEFMKDNTQMKFLDLTSIKSVGSNMTMFMRKNFKSGLEAIEFDYKVLYDYTSSGEYITVQPIQTSYVEELGRPATWKFYDNEGRRSWIYKTDDVCKKSKQNLNTSNLVFYDLETGNKIVNSVKKPDFLKYASRKINCSIGYYNLNGYRSKKNLDESYCWPVEFSQRGIYNYYSLNVK
ncbi:F-box protein [Candida tropicalis]